MSAAEPAGDAEGGDAAREVRYAEPWMPMTEEKKKEKELRRKKVMLFTMSIFMLVGLYFTVDAVLSENYMKTFGFTGMTVILCIFNWGMYHMGAVNKKMQKKNQGWEDIIRETKNLLIPMLLFVIVFSLFFLLIIFLFTSLTLGESQFYIRFSIFFIITFFILRVEKYLPNMFNRNFEIPVETATHLLESSAIQVLSDSNRSEGWFGRRIYKDKKVRIVVQKNEGKAAVIIRTPREQPEHNRELREAVSAVLEGRPLPPARGDSG